VKSTFPKVALVVSVALLLGVVVAQVTGVTGTNRSDLKGAEVRGGAVRTDAVRTDAVRTEAVKFPAGKVPTSVKRSASPQRSALPGAGTSAGQPGVAQPDPSTSISVSEPGVPSRITIPSLGLNANVVPVGIEDDGAMEIPNAVEAGWYRFGPRPGSPNGSAVIAGHVDHRKTPGVFIELRRLDIGAEVSVTDDTGKLHRYVVTERYQVNKHELPVKELFRRTGEPVLTLITCGGEFDRKTRSYDDNIVITAIPLGA
jgi:LPXTG-site transpeptidase (sortase) family protein